MGITLIMRRGIYIAIICFLVALAALMIAGRIAISPANQDIGDPPTDLPIETSTLVDEDGKVVKAWVVNGKAKRGVILLLHGIRADRRSMLHRARMLFEEGYSLILIDQQAHGESDGETITFGHLEARSASAAVKFARARWPSKKLAIIGTSLGGAAAIFAAKQQRADAYILEAVYSSLQDAVENRLRIRLGDFGALLAPLLLWQTPLQLGLHFDELSTINQIDQIEAPILIIAGGKDERTTLEDTNLLFASATHPKTLWIIPNAAHQDFFRFSKNEYSRRVLNFLNNSLK